VDSTTNDGAAMEPSSEIPHELGDLHRLLVSRVLDYAIFALDPHGNILSWNAGAERLKGYAPHEIIGRHFSVFYPPEDIAARKPERELEIAVAEGRVEDEGWRIRKDGTRFWANVLITALRDDNGVLVGFAKVTRDLTARRMAEDALRASEERFRLMVLSVKDYAIFMLDPTGHVATWNEGAHRINGYDADEIIGKYFAIFYPETDKSAGKPARELEVATSEGKFEEEGQRIRKDGSTFWASVVITPVYSVGGNLLGFAKVTRDLTERRAAEEKVLENARRLALEEGARGAAESRANELRTLAERLQIQSEELERRSAEAETANRAKSEFLAAMSHELRTPLNAIGGYAQLMQLGVSGPVTADQQLHLERIQRSQQHLLGIINDLLSFSRIEAGQIEYHFESLRLSEAIESVAAMIEPQARERKVRLARGSCPAEAAVNADRARFEQILINLLSNAIKFTPAGGDIEVACEASADDLCVSVRDNGIGIPQDQLERIFAPFAQVGRTLASPKEGTGLGLAISRDLARAMHGDLTVTSRLGHGSTFTLRLPRSVPA
jgi:PAS domain S-box-containing protein